MKPGVARMRGIPTRWLQAVSFGLGFLLLVVVCRPLFHWLVHFVFNEPREDMAHGWFVPVFSLALLWLKRDDLRREAGAPSWMGVLVALPAIFLFVVGTLGDQVRITHIGAILLLWSLFLATWGLKFAKAVSFPVVFLLFTVPMSFLDFLTVKLRMVISVLSAILLSGFGIPVQRVGTGLVCLAGEGFSLDIADPCSGLRSIFALTALTAAYAYLKQKTLRGKWLLFACSVPLAMLGNLARIFSIALVARFFGQKVATGFYHDYSGFVVFIVAVSAMIWLDGVISRLCDGPATADAAGAPAPAPAPEGGAAGSVRATPARLAALAVLPAAIVSMAAFIRSVPPPAEEADDFLAEALGPLPSYTAMYPYYCQNDQCGKVFEAASLDAIPGTCPTCGAGTDTVSLGERTILPPDTRFMKCNYSDWLGDVWRVTVVVNGKRRLSIHRPEICLPAQGMSIEGGHVAKFRLADGTTLPIHCMKVRSRDSVSDSRMGFAYFFVSARERVASHFGRIMISVKDRVFRRKVTRWAMVTLSGEEPFDTTAERKAATEAFLSEFRPVLERGGGSR